MFTKALLFGNTSVIGKGFKAWARLTPRVLSLSKGKAQVSNFNYR